MKGRRENMPLDGQEERNKRAKQLLEFAIRAARSYLERSFDQSCGQGFDQHLGDGKTVHALYSTTGLRKETLNTTTTKTSKTSKISNPSPLKTFVSTLTKGPNPLLTPLFRACSYFLCFGGVGVRGAGRTGRDGTTMTNSFRSIFRTTFRGKLPLTQFWKGLAPLLTPLNGQLRTTKMNWGPVWTKLGGKSAWCLPRAAYPSRSFTFCSKAIQKGLIHTFKS